MPSATSFGGLQHIAPAKQTDDYSVDIIAVPGLGADPARSFIYESGDKYDWLKDEKEGLLHEIPTARVLKFGYDSRWKGGNALNQTLGNVAESLLDCLVDNRKDHDTRPIIFLAHSLGGLVVAKALTLAIAHPEKIERVRIYECFAGAIFFGTPFGGSNEAARHFMLGLFYSTKIAIPSQILQVLDPQRDSLQELRADFADLLLKEPKASIACISELRETNYAQKLGSYIPKLIHATGLVVNQASATLDGAEHRAMACDHSQLPRFINGRDERFIAVKLLLQDIERDASRIVKKKLNASKRSVVDDDTISRLSEALNIVSYQRKRKSLESASGNSEWILNEPAFLQWLPWNSQDDAKSNFLWVSGTEGLGKSKAALAAIENIEEKAIGKRGKESEVILAYFFCDSTTDSQSAENMLSSLMWQLILKRRSLAQYVRGFAPLKSAKSLGTRSSIGFSKLWAGLQDMLRDESAPDVYFVVNNLHYLTKDESTVAFWDKIKDLVTDSNPDESEDPVCRKVKWMFLSRARDNIRSVLATEHDGKVARVNLEDGSKNKELRQMLKIFTHDRVKVLAGIKKYSLALQYFLTSTLLKRAENNKLWVEVVCCLLEALPSTYVEVRRTLESLPQSVEELMSRVWKESLNSDASTIHRTKEILRTLAIVYEDPTLDELKVLAELDDESNATQVLEQIRACGPLLRVYDAESAGGDLGSFRVTFIHDTAKIALLDEEGSRKLIGFSDTDDTQIRLQHGILAFRCFSHTVHETDSDEFEIDYSQLEEKDEIEVQIKDDAPELKDLFPEVNSTTENTEEEEIETEGNEEEAFLEYPVKYWLRHGYEATPDFVDTLDLTTAFWASDSTARQRWWSCYARGDGGSLDLLQNLTAMHIAAYFGLTPLIDSLISEKHENEIHVRDSWDNQPLHWAAAKGHVDAMEKLILHGADTNDGQQDHVWTPLHMAASEGMIQAMNLLIHEHGTNLDAVDKDIGTALTLALSCNQDKAVELLLSSGASPILTAKDGESPMAMAAYMGEEELIQILLEKGGSHSLVSKRFGSAMAAAASAGQISIVKILMPYSNTAAYQGALKEATLNSFHLIVKLLLESSNHLRCDDEFQTAASYGHDLVLKEFWNHNQAHGEEHISQDAVNNALYMAAENEQETTVTFLLEHCHADPNALGSTYENAIMAAAYDGSLGILYKLLEFGVNLNDSDGYPLQAAASQGHLDAVKLLLDHGADIDANSHIFPDGTALQAACAARRVDIANELLERGANPNLGSGPLTNPITAATTNTLGDLVILLLEKGANPNVTGGSDDSTPLINAAVTLESKYLAVMIKHGALVNTVDHEGDTALIICAYYKDIDGVRVLLDHGAKVNFCGKHYGTALHAAAQEGYFEICQLLLERGADPSIRGGPFDTVVQAAAYSGEKKCMEILFSKKTWSRKIDVNLQGGQCFTALHAAVVNEGDGCLRLLLERKPKLDIVPSTNATASTALYAAASAGCNRNARLLLEAGADPNIGNGKLGDALQAAALKCSAELCKRLIEHKAKVDDWSGKYGSALVAAVVKDYHQDDTDVLKLLLEQNFAPKAYRAALEKAFVLQRKDAFKLIWLSIKTKGSKKLNMNTKELLAMFKRLARKKDSKVTEQEDKNSDFGSDVDYYDQDIESEYEEEESDVEDENVDATDEKSTQNNASAEQSKMGQNETVANRTLRRSIPNNSRGINPGVTTGSTPNATRNTQTQSSTTARNIAGSNMDDDNDENADNQHAEKSDTEDLHGGASSNRKPESEETHGDNLSDAEHGDGAESGRLDPEGSENEELAYMGVNEEDNQHNEKEEEDGEKEASDNDNEEANHDNEEAENDEGEASNENAEEAEEANDDNEEGNNDNGEEEVAPDNENEEENNDEENGTGGGDGSGGEDEAGDGMAGSEDEE